MGWSQDASRKHSDAAGNEYTIIRSVETREVTDSGGTEHLRMGRPKYETSAGYRAERMSDGVFQIEHPRLGSVEVRSDEPGKF